MRCSFLLAMLILSVEGIAYSEVNYSIWHYAKDSDGRSGYFVQDGSTWREYKQGELYATFTETDRTDDYVELFDNGRSMQLRLGVTSAEWSTGDGWHRLPFDGIGDRGAEAVYVLLVIDTNAANVGTAMSVNGQRMREVLTEVFSSDNNRLKGRLFVDVMEGDNLTPEKLLEHYSKARHPVNSNSNLVCYYCGHGATDPLLGHYFATSGGNILRRDLHDRMSQLRPRSSIILSDCCSSFATFIPPQRRTPAKWKAFYNLFYQNSGDISITAASRGQFGWCDAVNGGMFTRAMTKYLCEPSENIRADGQPGIVSWTEFFEKVKQQTNATFSAARDASAADAEIRNSSSQTPEAFSLGQQ